MTLGWTSPLPVSIINHLLTPRDSSLDSPSLMESVVSRSKWGAWWKEWWGDVVYSCRVPWETKSQGSLGWGSTLPCSWQKTLASVRRRVRRLQKAEGPAAQLSALLSAWARLCWPVKWATLSALLAAPFGPSSSNCACLALSQSSEAQTMTDPAGSGCRSEVCCTSGSRIFFFVCFLISWEYCSGLGLFFGVCGGGCYKV